MRVAHVIRQFHPATGELANSVGPLAKHQRLLGINAEVITLNRQGASPSQRLPEFGCSDGVPVCRVGRADRGSYRLAASVLSAIEPFDIVHVHGTGGLANLLAYTRLIHRKPLVLSLERQLAPAALSGNLAIPGVSVATIPALLAYKRVFAGNWSSRPLFENVSNRIRQINHGVDTARFAGCGALARSPHLLYPGPLSAQAGGDELLAAFSMIARCLPSARLTLAGRARGHDVEVLRAGLGQLPDASAVTVQFDSRDGEYRNLLGGNCFVVIPKWYDGCEVALIEAMAAGLCPIVGCDLAGIVGATDGALSMSFADRHLAGVGIAAHMGHVSAHFGEARAAAMSLAERYSWPNVARAVTREYEYVLGLRGRKILGVNVGTLGRAKSVTRIDHALASGRRLNACFANAHSLNIAAANEKFRDALDSFLVLNDGLGLDIASMMKFGKRFQDNLNGTDFVPFFLSKSRHRLRIYLIGTTDPVVAKAARILRAQFPRHSIVGWRNGFFSSLDDIEHTCADIRAAGADCILVGMGNPLQELWIHEHGGKTNAKLLIGVGALFDFLAGRVSRAPIWVRNARCEWIYRLLQEPRRLFRRYLIGNFVFLGRVIGDARR